MRSTDWLHEKHWGVFVHYLPGGDSFASCIAGFDAPGLAAQLRAVNAGYLIFSIGQNNGFYNAPNPVYDELVNFDRASTCATRDLVSELHAALAPLGIPLLLYAPSNAPEDDMLARERLSWEGFYGRNRVFGTHWQRIIRYWAEQYGTKIAGWWFDGCWGQKEQYAHPDAPNWESYANAARAGNPDALLAFNPGWVDYGNGFGPLFRNGGEDYIAGEINDPQVLPAPDGRFLDGVQYHLLSYQSHGWSDTVGAAPRFSDSEFLALTRRVTEVGGVMSWDVPQSRETGLLMPECFAQLQVLQQ